MGKLHWLALSKIDGLGGTRARRLLEHFGNVEAAFKADTRLLAEITNLKEEHVAVLQATSLEGLAQELEGLRHEGIEVLTPDDADYPVLLRELRDTPPVLYLRGSLQARDQYAVAIVGSRMTNSGEKQENRTRELARSLAEWGITIVSGLALGVDAWAHNGALDAVGGRTLAVLGCGLRHIYPRAHWELAERIVRQGALVSEVAPEAPPSGSLLMMRNRLITALAQAVIVVEANDPSGSLDTAQHALKLGRRVLAVPGSPGTDRLLAFGAELLHQERADFDELARSILQAEEVNERRVKYGLSSISVSRHYE